MVNLKLVLGAVAVCAALVGTETHAQGSYPGWSGAVPTLPIIAEHVVQPNQWLWCIGRAYGVDPNAIALVNGLANPNILAPGTVLKIPAAYRWLPPGPVCYGTSVPQVPSNTWACTTYHYVSPGDTLLSISRWYGVSMWRIASANAISNYDRVLAYTTLCIPPAY